MAPQEASKDSLEEVTLQQVKGGRRIPERLDPDHTPAWRCGKAFLLTPSPAGKH